VRSVLCTWNVCLGSRNKIKLIADFIVENKIDILCLQEAEVLEDYNIEAYKIRGYTLETEKSLPHQTKRTSMYIRSDIKYQRRHELELPESHIIAITLDTGIGIAAVYRSYKLTHKPTHLLAFEEQISILTSFISKHSRSIILGDFNLDYNKRNEPSYHHRTLFDRMIEFEDQNELLQTVTFNTWTRKSGNFLQQSLLDHVYASDTGIIDQVAEGSATISDHCPVIVILNQHTKQDTKKKIWSRDWSKYSKERLLSGLGRVNWDIKCLTVPDFNDELEQKIMSVVDGLIPFKPRKTLSINNTENPNITALKKKRKHLYQRAKRRSSATLLDRSKALATKINKLIHTNKKQWIRNAALCGGQRGLWRAYARAEGKTQEAYPEEIKYNDVAKSTPEEKADAFSRYFRQKVETIVSETSIDPNTEIGEKVLFETEENFFSIENVEKVMLNLKPKQCYGYDNIPVRILLDGIEFLLKPFHKLLNMIYNQRVIPDQWRTSRIIPLHKKGPKNKVENYRPISNLCAGSKVFERLILIKLTEFDQDIMFTKSQHGFRKQRSTITAGKELQSILAQAMDSGDYVAVASLDLSAAFDVINVIELLRRLSNMGIPQDIVGLLSAWLQNRTAYVEIEASCSEFYEVNEGTVQGSVLGPILFNLYIRHLLVIHAPICFADDGYYYSTGKTKEEATGGLERKLKSAVDWLTGSGLKVNITKTEFTVFHRSLNTAGRIRIGTEWIGATQEMGILGIVFDSRLEWTKQVDKSILKARQSSQALRRIKDYFTIRKRIH
jgi:exonuclease III